MAGVEDLPADLREQAVGPPRLAIGSPAPRERPDGRSFIGGKAKEYAPGMTRPVPPEPPVPPGAEASTGEEPKVETKECDRCAKSIATTVHFCPNCGLDYKRQRAADALGVELTTDELDDYLFKGHVVKAVKLFGEHVATFKSVQAGEVDQADALTSKFFDEKKPTDLEWLNYRSKVLISFGWLKLDGKPIGDSPEKRLAYIQNAGSQLVELVGKKFSLLNQSITEVLNGDVLKKS